jgi:hypothetical protein
MDGHLVSRGKYNWNTIAGIYIGTYQCRKAIINFTSYLAFYANAYLGISIESIKISVALELASAGTASAISIPLGLFGVNSFPFAATWTIYELAQLSLAIKYAKQYNKFQIRSVWKSNQLMYEVVRWN